MTGREESHETASMTTRPADHVTTQSQVSMRLSNLSHTCLTRGTVAGNPTAMLDPVTTRPTEEVHPKAKLIGDRIEVSCRIQGLPTKVSWDTGAQVSLTCEAWLTEHLPPDSYIVRPAEELIKRGLYLKGAGGGDIAYSGYTELSFRLGKSE